MRYTTLLVALALCAAASFTVALDAPWRLSVVCVGAFLLLVPGLLVVHVLALPDRLLALVVGLLTGPSLWVLIGALQLFAGLWAPRLTVLLAAGVFGLLTLLLAARGVRRESESSGRLDQPDPGSRVEQYALDQTD